MTPEMNREKAEKATPEEIADAQATFAKLGALARAVETPEDQVALAEKLIDEYDFAPLEASVFIYLERYGRDGETTAPL